MSLDFDSIESLPWKQLIERVIGVNPSALEDDYWVVRLKEHLYSENIHNIDRYFEYLSGSSYKSNQWRQLSHKLLNNTTSFFRHPQSFLFVDDVVSEKIKRVCNNVEKNDFCKKNNQVREMSELLSRRFISEGCLGAAQEKTNDSFFSVWSVGCSTGEESYSLSATVYHSLQKVNKEYLPYVVIASDISDQAIRFAEKAEYHTNDFLRCDLKAWKDYFYFDKERTLVAPTVAHNVRFMLSSILEKPVFENTFDVVFCQNLLIYFRRWRVREILNQLSSSVVEGGVLIVGVGEAQHWSHPDFVRVDNPNIMAFRRVRVN